MTSTTITTVLVDADGIIQTVDRGWVQRLSRFCPDDAEAFIAELFAAERGPLSGQGEWADAIAGVLRRRGIEVSFTADVILPWAIIEQWPDCLDVVREVAATGRACHLATNQTRFRADIMRTFGYQQVFDQLLFSYELGAHKPDPAYFTAALDRVGAAAEETFFIDDKLENVEAAASLGITAVLHRPAEGAAGLRRHFIDAGLL